MNDDHPHALPIPPGVGSKPNHRELLRVWAGDGGMSTILVPDLWEDPASWGIALVDVMRHISNARAEKCGEDAEYVLERIVEGLIAELKDPTDRPGGQWLAR